MQTPRSFIPSIISTALLICAGASFNGSRAEIFAQQDQAAGIIIEDAKRGIEFYQKGDDKSAIESLRRAVKEHRDLIGAWYYLGLAYEREGKQKDARKAYEKATVAGETLIEKLFDMSLSQPADAIGQYKQLISLAAESANKYIKLGSNLSPSKLEEWNSRAESLREYANATGNNGQKTLVGKVYSPKDVTTKARITGRPEPQYTEEARGNKVSGTIVLRAILAFDGKVRGIRVVSGLPDGLTQKAIEAARHIKFIPATVNGQPVSQYIQIEYNFSVF